MRLAAALAIVVAAALVVSDIAPFDRGTWLLEVAPVLIAFPILAATRRRFPGRASSAREAHRAQTAARPRGRRVAVAAGDRATTA